MYPVHDTPFPPSPFPSVFIATIFPLTINPPPPGVFYFSHLRGAVQKNYILSGFVRSGL